MEEIRKTKSKQGNEERKKGKNDINKGNYVNLFL
jgi:hypothetical protein